MTCVFLAGIGQHGQVLQERPQDSRDVLAGSRKVMDIGWQDIRHPWFPVAKQDPDVPAEIIDT